jgi:hypothetical protein
MIIMAMPSTIKARAEHDKGETSPVGEGLTAWRDLPLRCLRRNVSQEQIEPFYQKAKGHDRNCCSHPSEKGSFIGRVVAVALYHGSCSISGCSTILFKVRLSSWQVGPALDGNTGWAKLVRRGGLSVRPESS